MTFADPNSRVERARCVISRVALVSATCLLALGLVLAQIGQAGYPSVLQAACAILLAVPILNAVTALLEETGRRDWPFVAAGLVVISLVAYSVIEKMR